MAEKASKNYNPNEDNADDKRSVSRQTIELFFKFLTSKTGMFMKKPLVYELSEAIDGLAGLACPDEVEIAVSFTGKLQATLVPNVLDGA